MTVKPVALVTGCSTGVGLCTALRLARTGHEVVATMRDTAKQGPLVDQAAQSGLELDVRELDVAVHSAIEACIAGVMADYGRIDVLVNNAGAGIIGSLEQTTDAELRWLMEVNFFGVWNATRAVVPAMRAAGSGRIISVTSVGGMVGQPFNDAYCAAKFAVEGLMESFAPLAEAMGIKVCVVAPGPVNTEFVANLDAASSGSVAAMAPPYDRMLRNYFAASATSFEKYGQTPDEVAAIIEKLATVDDPDFRTMTAPLVSKVVAAKASDPAGNLVIGNFARMIAAG